VGERVVHEQWGQSGGERSQGSIRLFTYVDGQSFHPRRDVRAGYAASSADVPRPMLTTLCESCCVIP